MSVIVRRGSVDDGARIYRIDEIIRTLSPIEEKQLVDDGYCHFYVDHLKDPLQDTLVNAQGVVLTVEEFSKLKADKQKELLETLKVDPASKAEDRVDQYQEWFDLQVDDSLNPPGSDDPDGL